MTARKSKALHVLTETLEAASSATQFYDFKEEEKEYLRSSFRKLLNMITMPEWISQEPDFPELDKLLGPLSRKLKGAKELGYENTFFYGLRAAFYGIGIGYRPLTWEERRNEVPVLFRRRLQMQKYMEIIEISENLDFWTAKEQGDKRRIGVLCDSIEVESQKMELLLQSDPYILEDVCYATHSSHLDGSAKEYFDLRVHKRDMEEELEDLEDSLTQTEYKAAAFKRQLEDEVLDLKHIEIFSDFVESDIVPEYTFVLQLIEDV